MGSRDRRRYLTGIQPGREKQIGQDLGESAKAAIGGAFMTAHLAMVEDQGKGIGQQANHGEYEEGLLPILMDRGFLEMTIGGEGLKHLGVDDPAAAT